MFLSNLKFETKMMMWKFKNLVTFYRLRFMIWRNKL